MIFAWLLQGQFHDSGGSVLCALSLRERFTDAASIAAFAYSRLPGDTGFAVRVSLAPEI